MDARWIYFGTFCSMSVVGMVITAITLIGDICDRGCIGTIGFWIFLLGSMGGGIVDSFLTRTEYRRVAGNYYAKSRVEEHSFGWYGALIGQIGLGMVCGIFFLDDQISFIVGAGTTLGIALGIFYLLISDLLVESPILWIVPIVTGIVGVYVCIMSVSLSLINVSFGLGVILAIIYSGFFLITF